MPPKTDVRRLFKKQQAERTKSTRVTHPFAKYNEEGQLTCIVCHSIVKSESIWQAHLGSTGHRDNIQKLKALKQQQQLKRPASAEIQDQTKRVKLDKTDIDESSESEPENETSLPPDFYDKPDTKESLPNDFFDQQPTESVPDDFFDETPEQGLPKNFFDDPDEDAKAQGALAPEEQAKMDLANDLESFHEAMVDVTKEAREVQDEDDEMFWKQRNLEIFQEQAEFDARVEKLKQMRTGRLMEVETKDIPIETDEDKIKVELKSSVRQILKSKPTQQVQSMFDDDMEETDDDEDDDDWRAQQL